MKILKGFFVLMFLGFAVIQYNDPDPLVWFVVYGSMTVVSAMAIWDRYPGQIMIAMAGGFLLLSIMYFEGFLDWLNSADRMLLFSEPAKMELPYIEPAREFMGLLICEAVLILYFYQDKKHSGH